MTKKYNAPGLTHITNPAGTEKWGVESSGADAYVTPADIKTYIGQGLIALARTNGSEASGDETTLQFNTVDYDPGSTITTGSSWHFTAPTTAKYLIAILHMLVVPTSGMNYTAGDELKILRYATGKSVKVITQVTKGITETQNEPYNTLLGLDVVSLTAADQVNYNFVRNVSDGDPTIASDATIAILRIT